MPLTLNMQAMMWGELDLASTAVDLGNDAEFGIIQRMFSELYEVEFELTLTMKLSKLHTVYLKNLPAFKFGAKRAI